MGAAEATSWLQLQSAVAPCKAPAAGPLTAANALSTVSPRLPASRPVISCSSSSAGCRAKKCWEAVERRGRLRAERARSDRWALCVGGGSFILRCVSGEQMEVRRPSRPRPHLWRLST